MAQIGHLGQTGKTKQTVSSYQAPMRAQSDIHCPSLRGQRLAFTKPPILQNSKTVYKSLQLHYKVGSTVTHHLFPSSQVHQGSVRLPCPGNWDRGWPTNKHTSKQTNSFLLPRSIRAWSGTLVLATGTGVGKQTNIQVNKQTVSSFPGPVRLSQDSGTHVLATGTEAGKETNIQANAFHHGPTKLHTAEY